MSARFSLAIQDAEGNAQSGVTVQLWNAAHSSLLGSFTEVGTSGEYYIDYGMSGKYAIKVGGSFPTALDGIQLGLDDMIYATLLASTANGEGASLVGIEDAGARITAIDVEGAFEEVPTFVELASVVTNYGASLVGIEDSGLHYVANDVEAALQELGTIAGLLDGLLADAADLNVLESTAITKAELDALHGYDAIFDVANRRLGSGDQGEGIKDLIGYAGDGYALPLIIYGAKDFGAQVNRGIRLDCGGAGAETAGWVSIKTDDGEWDVISEYEIGDLDLSASHFLAAVDPADEGFVTNCFRTLDSRLWTLTREMNALGGFYDVADDSAKKSSLGDVNSDVAAFTYWYNDSAIWYTFYRRTLNMMNEAVSEVRVRFKGEMSGASGGYVQLFVDGVVQAQASIEAGAAAWYLLTYTCPGTATEPQEVTLKFKGETTSAVRVYENVLVEVSH